MQFTPKCKIIQSDLGTSLKIVDDSNYDDNDDNIDEADVISRTVVIKDAAGDVVDTVLLTLVDDDGKYYNAYGIVNDGYWKFTMTLDMVTGPDEVTTTAYLATRFYKNKYVEYMSSSCGDECGCKHKDCTNLTWAQRFFDAAELLAARDAGLFAQNNILAANRLLDQLTTCTS